MLQLYATSEIDGKNHAVVEVFENWLLFEILMALSSIGTTILYLLIRLNFREVITLEM